MGSIMITAIAKWGNSLALRIPNAFAREISVRQGAAVDISVADGALVVRPIERAQVYDLDSLLAGITEDNLHREITACDR
jgi:antitoxin MazE